ncbi:flagellar protein FlgN [Chromatiaceae bacterium AAb-1]|nr:flagellar protein FlgN [Chromatiaceae bacterium AAb-1]
MITNQTDITPLFEQQKEHLNALLSLLRQEIASLAQRDIETLDAVCQQKLVVLNHIQKLDQQIAALPDLVTLKQQPWFKQHVDDIELQLQQCKQQNDINQQALEQSQLTLERFKTELLSARGKAGLTYTNKGKTAVDSKGKGIKA